MHFETASVSIETIILNTYFSFIDNILDNTSANIDDPDDILINSIIYGIKRTIYFKETSSS